MQHTSRKVRLAGNYSNSGGWQAGGAPLLCLYLCLSSGGNRYKQRPVVQTGRPDETFASRAGSFPEDVLTSNPLLFDRFYRETIHFPSFSLGCSAGQIVSRCAAV